MYRSSATPISSAPVATAGAVISTYTDWSVYMPPLWSNRYTLVDAAVSSPCVPFTERSEAAPPTLVHADPTSGVPHPLDTLRVNA
ncbi:MAG TPA: hypothetical protein VGJ44_22245, partial [Kribbellaceae bacterium]